MSVAGRWGIGTGTAGGTSVGWDLARPRLKRLAGEASGYLDEGETLVSPVAICTGVAAQPCWQGWAPLPWQSPCWRLPVTVSGSRALLQARSSPPMPSL